MVNLSIGNNYYDQYSYSPLLTQKQEEEQKEKLGLVDENKKADEEPKTPADKPGRKNPEECETCKKRKYQDASDEGNVSMKNATHVSPTAAGAAVRAHENMHMTNAYNKAEQKDAKVVQAYVTIHTSICAECGRTYVSGGTTHTQIKYPNESNPYQQGRKSEDAATMKGAKVDYNI